MRTPGLGIALGLSSTVLVLSVGCVPKEQYEKLNGMYRKCNEHREQLLQELQVAKDNNAALNSQLSGFNDQLAARDSEIARLKKEKDALSAEFDKMKAEALAALNQAPPEPKVIVRKLPAELHRALQDFATKFPEMVDYDAKRGAVKWKSDLVFASGSAIVKDSAKPSLEAFAKIGASPAAAKFDTIVVGHTDKEPIRASAKRHPSNWHLSVHRAISVNNLMIKYGVAATRTGVMGYGEFRPIAPNDPGTGRQAKNRRVEIYLVNRESLGVSRSDGMIRLKDGSLSFARVK